MKSDRVRLWLVAFVLIAAVGCSSTVPQPTPGPTVAAASVTSESTTAPQSQTTPSATSIPPAIDNWDDRTIFRTGLIKDEQPTLEQLPGASVYHLDVQIADELSALQGQMRVRYTNQETVPLDAVYFQLFPNQSGGKSTVSAVTVEGQAVTPVYESDNSTVRVPLSTPLLPGQRVVIQMDFKVEVPTELGGNYGLFSYLDSILALDGFYPAIPVYDAKGWHAGKTPPNADTTFQDASFYVVNVTAPATLTLVTSGIQVERTEKDNNQVVTFAAGPARDFYLAASDRFVVVSKTVGETQVNSYAFKDRTAGSQLAIITAVNAIKKYNARFGTYPYTEFDVVSTPMTAGGVEYPGLTSVNYLYYNLNSEVFGLPASVVLESVVAHEVGHQWFYNVVGNDQANEPWVDESITQYVTGRYYLDQYGQQGFDSYRDSWESRWDRVKREPMPIGLSAGSYQGQEYGAIVYGRGPLFIEALAQKMGQATFDQFLRDYYQSHQWGIGTAADFKQLADKHCQCDLTSLFNDWVTAPAAMPTPTTTLPSLPDGRGGGYIAFQTERHGRKEEIYLMNADGSAQTRLTDNTATDNCPAFSPDGTLIAFSSDRDGNFEIYSMSRDGNHQSRLTNLTGDDLCPTWSPDGSKIAFMSARDGNYEIYSMNADGSSQTRLTNNTWQDELPDWSPDGSKILFSSRKTGSSGIYVMNTDGSNVQTILDTSENEIMGRWSPDGRQIVFAKMKTFFSQRDVWLMAADGSNVTQLTNNPAIDEDADWSPDSQRLIFQSDRDGSYQLYMMNPDGSHQTKISTARGDYWPSWIQK